MQQRFAPPPLQFALPPSSHARSFQYGVLAALWFMTRSRYNVGTPWSPLTRVLLGTTISLPFVAALIALILRLVDDISVRDAAQYLFFATVVAVALLYGTIIVVFGALTLRDLARANESLGIGRVSNATPLRTSLVRRLAIQIVFSGIVLLLGVACLIIFLVVPVDSPLTFIWVQLFAPQVNGTWIPHPSFVFLLLFHGSFPPKLLVCLLLNSAPRALLVSCSVGQVCGGFGHDGIENRQRHD